MTVSQIILVLVTITLIVVTYLFGPLTSPHKQDASSDQVEQTEESVFDYEQYKKNELSKLPADVRMEYESLKNSYQSARNASEKTGHLNSIVILLKNHNPIISTIYAKELASVKDSADLWTLVGDDLMEIYYNQPLNAGLANFVINNATESYEKTIALHPDDLEVKVKLASTYMDGTNQVMNGVTILLEVIDKEPENLSANLILGRYGIISGQFDKAVKRLETVLQQDSMNAEAYFYLAEAYNGLGDKTKAIELFEKCKTLVNNPEFALEIDNYINKLKNS